MSEDKFVCGLNGRDLNVKIAGLATQANGEAMVQMGDTVVLVTAVMNKRAREGVDFFPLTVEFEEKYYASGRIKTSRFMKRESKPSDEAMLSGRLIDRAIRPRFPYGMRNEVQVVATTLSYDGENDPDVLALIGASTALSLSDIPWSGPIAGVRVAKTNGQLTLNPTESERTEADFEIVIAGTKDKINMLEGAAKETPSDQLIEAIKFGHEKIVEIIEAIEKFARTRAKTKEQILKVEISEEKNAVIKSFIGNRLEEALFAPRDNKVERMDKVNALKRETIERFGENELLTPQEIDAIFEEEINQLVHNFAINKKTRPDGRALDELRELSAQIGYLPRTHGSSVFSRGNTRALATVTLAGPEQELIVENMRGERKKLFMLHYNFPPFSVGDTKPMRGPGRREIGHGALAEKSLAGLIPKKDDFPYTVRVVSEIVSSNGSSSMATACAASLALMDAGVPIKRHVAGIAMGLMTNDKGEWVVLTDIQGPEDHHGDMDLKIAGTREGITGMQMDVKIEGASPEMLDAAFKQAREAHFKILEIMEKTISAPRPSVAEYAPKVKKININPEKIGALIGPGGKTINGIIAKTGAAINVENSGEVYVSSIDQQALEKAVEAIEGLTREAAVGEIFKGSVTRIFPFGAMIEILPGQEGLIHISELSSLNVKRPDDVFRSGEPIDVIVKEVDEQGRINLKPLYPERLEIKPVPPGFRHDGNRNNFRNKNKRPFQRY